MAGGTRNANKALPTDEENMEKLIDKVCARFVTRLEEKLDVKINKLETKISQVCESLKDLSISVRENSADIVNIQKRCDYLEQENKRNSIRIAGLKEEDGENLYAIVSSFITDKLNVPCSFHDIDYAFRLGKAEEGSSRAIIVRFLNNFKKSEVIAGKKILKGSNITIYEDLTRARYELLVDAKKKYGKNKAWSYKGRIFYWDAKENKSVMVNSKSDL